MNKILQNMAKRNMAKAAAMMMAIFASQQSSASMFGTMVDTLSSYAPNLCSPMVSNLVGPAVGGVLCAHPFLSAVGTAVGSLGGWYTGRKVLNYFTGRNKSIDNKNVEDNDTQTKQIKNIQNNMSTRAYSTGNNLGRSVISPTANLEGMLHNNTSVNESLDAKMVELVNKADGLGIGVSVDEGKFYVDGYEDGFDKEQMEAYLVSKEAEKNEILQNAEQTNDGLPNGASFVTKDEYNRLIKQDPRLKGAQIVKQNGYKVLNKDGALVNINHYLLTLNKSK